MNQSELEKLPEETDEPEREEVTCRIFQHYGVIGHDKNGWDKELNLVSWNDRAPRYDIRCWDHAHIRMTKGVTLSREETAELQRLLIRMEFGAEGAAVLCGEPASGESKKQNEAAEG